MAMGTECQDTDTVPLDLVVHGVVTLGGKVVDAAGEEVEDADEEEVVEGTEVLTRATTRTEQFEVCTSEDF